MTQKGIPLVTASNVTAYDEEDMDIFKFNLTDAEMDILDHFGVRLENAPPGNLHAVTRIYASEARGLCDY